MSLGAALTASCTERVAVAEFTRSRCRGRSKTLPKVRAWQNAFAVKLLLWRAFVMGQCPRSCKLDSTAECRTW